jgi:hypothetical protein
VKTQPCVRCGFCCKQGPCQFGAWDEYKKQCVHLTGYSPGQYTCSIAHEISRKPGSEMSPAFGAGCSSSLFNKDREAALRGRKCHAG